MPKISDAQRTARRAQILDAFRVCVAREGFHRTSMAAVIGEAGLSAGAVYGHFRSKTEMIHAIADEVLGFATQQLRDLAQMGQGVAPREVLGSLLRSAMEVYGEDTPFIAVQVWAELARDSDIRAAATAHLDDLLAVLAELVARCQETGGLPAGDPVLMARATLGFLPGYVVQRVVYPDLTPESYLDGALALMGAGA